MTTRTPTRARRAHVSYCLIEHQFKSNQSFAAYKLSERAQYENINSYFKIDSKWQMGRVQH